MWESRMSCYEALCGRKTLLRKGAVAFTKCVQEMRASVVQVDDQDDYSCHNYILRLRTERAVNN